MGAAGHQEPLITAVVSVFTAGVHNGQPIVQHSVTGTQTPTRRNAVSTRRGHARHFRPPCCRRERSVSVNRLQSVLNPPGQVSVASLSLLSYMTWPLSTNLRRLWVGIIFPEVRRLRGIPLAGLTWLS